MRLEPSSKGVSNRVIVGYKEAAAYDPTTDPTRRTTLWRNLGRAEQALIGVQFTSYNRITRQQQPFVVKNSQHWVYRNTGFQDGAVVPGIVGYEIDRSFAPYPPRRAGAIRIRCLVNPLLRPSIPCKTFRSLRSIKPAVARGCSLREPCPGVGRWTALVLSTLGFSGRRKTFWMSFSRTGGGRHAAR